MLMLVQVWGQPWGMGDMMLMSKQSLAFLNYDFFLFFWLSEV